MVTRLIRLVCFVWLVTPLCAQDTRGTWHDAVRLVDSSSQADIAAAIDKLKPIMADDRTLAPPAVAVTTLALLQLRQENYDAAGQTLARLSKDYTPSQLQARRGAMLRMSLIVALMRDDSVAADAAFKDLVRMVASEQGDPIDLKLNAHCIGTAVAMLGVQRAQSPIASRILKIGNDQMAVSKVRGVAISFQASFENGNERTEALVAHLARIEKDGIDAVQADLEQRKQKLKQRADELTEQKELTGEVLRNTKEQVEQNTQDARKLAGEINRINLKLNQPTPGHPGPKRPAPPPLPSPRSIPIDEYEVINDYDYVTQNGQTVRVPVTRQVRRPQSEIDRERNLIYDRIRNDYNRTINEYRNYEVTYNAALASWAQEDERRRVTLNNEKAELEVKRNDLLASIKAIKDDKKDSTKDLRAIRTETEQEQFEVELLTIAVEAYRSGQPHSAFRPKHFESLNWSQEKILLQKP